MTDFVGHQPAIGNSDNLQIDAFYPEVSTALLNDLRRNDVELDGTPLATQLKQAVYRINDNLHEFRTRQQADNLAALIPSETNFRSGAQLVDHYLSAVTATAKALLLADYPDATMTRDDTTATIERISAYRIQAHEDLQAFKSKRGNVCLL